MTQAPPPPTSRCSAPAGTPARVPGLLEGWLAGLLPDGADPQVTLHSGIDANGMSSETLVLDATWTEDGQPREGRVRRPGGAVRRGRPGLPELRPAGAVRRHQARRRPHRRPGAGRRLHGADRRGARHAVLPHGPDRGRRPAGRHALHLRRQLALRRLARTSSSGCRTARSACWPGCTRSRTPRRRSTTSTRPPPDRCRASGTPMERNLAARRAWYEFAVPDLGPSPMVEKLARLAGGQPARRPRRHRAELGRRPDRQHDVPRLRAGRGPRLGDGDHRPARAGRVVDGLRPPGLRVDRDGLRAAGDAALHARGGRARRPTSSSPAYGWAS